MTDEKPVIQVQENGPYIVRGDVPLASKTEVETEHGEPIAWRRGEEFETGERYALCRCGKSEKRPFCDGAHARIDFDGGETAVTDSMTDRQETIQGARITLNDDRSSLCISAGFCGSRLKNIWQMMDETDESTVRSQIAAMVERCPSGAITYALGDDADPIEPALAAEIGVVPGGPLWVTGRIPIERADGQPLEAINRLTLCRCGDSKRKPLCDGTHRNTGFEAE
jgi:CDGSH-type Zn-finger protein